MGSNVVWTTLDTKEDLKILFWDRIYIFDSAIHECFLAYKIFDVFERSLLCSPMLHLFDQKYSKKIFTIKNDSFLF